MKMTRKADMRMAKLNYCQSVLKQKAYNVQLVCSLTNNYAVNYYTLNKEWSVWVNTEQITAMVFPELSGFCLTESLMKEIADMSQNDLLWLDTFEDIIPVKDLIRGEVMNIPVSENYCMLKIRHDNFVLFIEKVPWLKSEIPVNQAEYRNLLFPVKVTVGNSALTLSTLRTLKAGNLILINSVRMRMISVKSEIVVNNWGEYSAMTEKFGSINEEDEMPGQEPQITVDDLTVVLEFVLFRTTMTLTELSDIQNKKVFILPEGVHKNLELRVNNQLIGRGELVEFDEELAIDLKQIFLRDGVKHD